MDDGFSSDYWGQEKQSHTFSKPQSFYLVFSNMADFVQVFGGFFVVGFFFPPVPLIYSLLTAHQLFTGYGDLQLQSLGFLFDCKRAASGTPSPAAAKVVSQTAGPATDHDTEGVKGSGPLVTEDLFYHTVFRDLSLPLPSSIRTVKKICFKHVTSMVSIREYILGINKEKMSYF